jgi:ABC-type bacteriocin/lantibiotic exporter with double-glycine peptidase domain
MRRRPFFAPEVLQTSAMDCGPASLRAVLAGLGVDADYERLREACRTGPDGTSIDAIEDLAVSLGLEAHQEMAPIADAATAMAKRAPCVIVVKGAGDAPHFVVLWRTFMGFVQLMDPGRGRVWLSRSAFARMLFPHTQPFEEDPFAEWFAETEWKKLLDGRLTKLGALPGLLSSTRSIAGIGALDAGARFVERLIEKRAIPKTAGVTALEAFMRVAAAEKESLRLPPALAAIVPNREGTFVVRGAVFLAVGLADPKQAPIPVSEELRGVLASARPSAAEVFARNLRPIDKRLGVLLLILTAMLGSLAVAEMFFLRAAFNADALLTLPQQRFAGTVIYGVLVAILMVFEVQSAKGVVRLGRALELRTRLALLAKLPKLPDSYFRTRPLSDVTHRSQGLFAVKPLPRTLVDLAKHAVDLLVTVSALAILFPRGIPIAIGALFFGLAGPYVGVRIRKVVEGRVQNHASALGQLYLDVLLGLIPLRTHGGQQAIRARQNEHLVSWRRESERSVRVLSVTEAVQAIGLLSLMVLFLFTYLRVNGSHGSLLLVVFWALKLPLEARALSASVESLPATMASMARLIEPLTARESPTDVPDVRTGASADGIALSVRRASVQRGVEQVLADVSLEIPAGQRVAIVGSSGAGKSTLFGVLLGLLERSEGEVCVDEAPIEDYGIGRLRRETVWVDPSIQLWNRSFIENLQFGNPRGARHPLEAVLDVTQLKDLLERMPKGFATELGESGARVSGGEGQRVRLSRALLRRGARLFLLDEAFRGLDRPTRRTFSRRVRERAGNATVLEITHDVADTRDFDRILVIEDGRLIEDGAPTELLGTPGSRYAELVQADRDVLENVWNAPHWKRVIVERGTVSDG